MKQKVQKTLKILSYTFLFLVLSFIVYFQHLVTFDAEEVTLFGKTYDLSKDGYFTSYYSKYFFLKDENPTYVWRNDVFTKYAKSCHESNKTCLVLPHQQSFADSQWISSIQYIGSVFATERAPYLPDLLDNITNLSPYWDYPYFFGQLLIPVSKGSINQDLLTENQRKESRKKGIVIGEKGRYYNCDPIKVEKILGLETKEFYRIVSLKGSEYEELNNVCDLVDIPSYLGFNYFYYLNDGENSAKNYKLASFDDNSIASSSSMVAIVTGRQGEHLKSMHLWFSQYQSLLEKYNQSAPTDKDRDMLLTKSNEALQKSLAQYQLNVIKKADESMFDKPECMRNFKCLVDSGAILRIIKEQIPVCQSLNIQQSDLNLQDYAQLSEEDNELTTKLQCVMLSYGLSSGYIDINTGNFIHPQKGEDGVFTFKFDEDLTNWISFFVNNPRK
ncbi:MAG: hypothetical protein V3575_03790 [Candidatus Absconditabacteria bacterium]